MGLETECKARWRGKSSVGKAHLGQDALTFRGDFRLVLPLKSFQSAEASRGWLRVKSPQGIASFRLGPGAEKWAHRIRNPRSRIDKLGVKPGSRVAVVGGFDRELRRELRARGAKQIRNFRRNDSEVILLRINDKEGLRCLPRYAEKLASAGALWVVYPKGRREVTQNDVMAAGRAARLVDVKVVSFSDTHTALKFVIPLSRR